MPIVPFRLTLHATFDSGSIWCRRVEIIGNNSYRLGCQLQLCQLQLVSERALQLPQYDCSRGDKALGYLLGMPHTASRPL